VVVFFDTTYASVKKMVRKVCHERGAVATEKTLPVLHAHLSPDALAHAIVGLSFVFLLFLVCALLCSLVSVLARLGRRAEVDLPRQASLLTPGWRSRGVG